MASTSAQKVDKTESQKRSKSFSRLETASPSSSLQSSRANTIQNDAVAERQSSETEHALAQLPSRPAVPNEDSVLSTRTSIDFDDLPIELKSLTDRYELHITFRSIMLIIQSVLLILYRQRYIQHRLQSINYLVCFKI